MKHTLLLVLAAASMLLASCGNGGSADKQHIIDSLVKLVPAGAGGRSNMDMAVPGAVNTFTTAPVPDYYIGRATADTLIQQYHALFKGNTPATIPAVNLNRSSFVIPTATVQSLIDSGCQYMVFYFGYDPASQYLNLIYTGIRPVGNTENFSEITMNDPDIPGKPMVFDNGQPCPTCTGIGIHSQFGGLSSVIEIDGVINGTMVSPAGNLIQVRYGKDQKITYQANDNFKFDSVVVDDTIKVITGQRPNIETEYTFYNVRQTHTIKVYFGKN